MATAPEPALGDARVLSARPSRRETPLPAATTATTGLRPTILRRSSRLGVPESPSIMSEAAPPARGHARLQERDRGDCACGSTPAIPDGGGESAFGSLGGARFETAQSEK